MIAAKHFTFTYQQPKNDYTEIGRVMKQLDTLVQEARAEQKNPCWFTR